MIVNTNSPWEVSDSPHSLGLQRAITTPSPWWDTNRQLINNDAFLKAGLQGCPNCNKGIRGLTFDGSGLLGTGLFSGDIFSWGWGELLFGLIGAYAVYAMFFQAKQTKYRMEAAAGRRRKRTAKKLRERAKMLEEQTEGIF